MKRLEQLFILLIPVVFIILSAMVMLTTAGAGPTALAQSVTPTPVVAGPASTPDTSLARIQQAGKLVIGTSFPMNRLNSLGVSFVPTALTSP
jgi:hypothetical protein